MLGRGKPRCGALTTHSDKNIGVPVQKNNIILRPTVYYIV